MCYRSVSACLHGTLTTLKYSQVNWRPLHVCDTVDNSGWDSSSSESASDSLIFARWLCYNFIISHKLVVWIICIYIEHTWGFCQLGLSTKQPRSEKRLANSSQEGLWLFPVSHAFKFANDSNRWKDQLFPKTWRWQKSRLPMPCCSN